MLKEQALKILRDKIAKIIADLETWNTLHDVRSTLSLPAEDFENIGKLRYLQTVTSAAKDQIIVDAAQRIIDSYPGNRGQPSPSVLRELQDSLWWIEKNGIQDISKVCRYNIAESLDGFKFWGRLTPRDTLLPIIPTIYNVPEAGNDGYMYRTHYNHNFGESYIDSLIAPKKENWIINKISLSEYLQEQEFTNWPDQRFCLLLERLVHPEVQSAKNQQVLIGKVGPLLKHDGFELQTGEFQGGLPVYKVKKKGTSLSGSPKYVIFAATQKPGIVIEDVLDVDVRIVENADSCIVYDQPPIEGDLTWQMLVDWWAERNNLDSQVESTRKDLGGRLIKAVEASNSPSEKYFFIQYFKEFQPKLGSRLPALFPQVYLHYDPKNRNQRNEPILARQRMDFLMLLRDSTRIVIEIDGMQHYSDGSGRASPKLYAEMVAEDRRIKN
ncbi:MAG: hypothetical protein WBC73_23085, partial [Phormidesmis sp.]